MSNAEIASYRVEDGVAVLTIDSPPVNALGHAVRIALCEGVTRALDDPEAKALVLICGGRTFFAGADVTEIGKPILPPLLADVMAAFEGSTKPIVSAMHGTALGGGLELALAGHYRVAVPSAVVGLPEVALGLLPGAGGTQRVPRLIGVAAAVEMIGLGKPVKAEQALQIGLIDAIVPEGELETRAIGFARDLVANGAPLRRVRDQAPNLTLEEARVVFDRFRAANPDLFFGLKAADGVLQAIEAAITLPFEAGLNREREISRALIAGPESAAQRHLFFAERAAAKLPGAEKAKAGDGRVAMLPDTGDRATYLAAIAEADGELILATRFLDAFDDLAGAAVDPSKLVGMRTVEGVTEIILGPQTNAQAALQAMAITKKRGETAIFVSPAPGGVVQRLSEKIAVTIAGLLSKGVPAGVIAATGRNFGFRDALLPDGNGEPDPAIEQRLIYPVLAEAIALRGEGVAKRSSDIDVAMVKAKLWPVWRGGPAFMADRIGPDVVRAGLTEPAPA
ncbi:enoyl-CoA hydratase-related protein [Sphingomonas sp. ID0503]|uniref:enoyl-CoA hydratase-related protein n=1 Tax=Sphingomonas sp. ID0503 TaxID=3399691 RepID=UPI003AFA75F0